MELIANGQAYGSLASRLLSSGFETVGMRPWIGKDGYHYVMARNAQGQLVPMRQIVGNATLRRDEWIQIDQAVTVAARERLRLIADLRGSGLTYNIPNGFGKTVLESQRMGDITPATISMDPIRKSEADRPEFDLIGLPLPVIHKDFFYTARELATSRNGGAGLDVTTVQLATRRVVEEAEKLALGVSNSGFMYGGYSIYGLTTFPGRLTKVLMNPNQSPWTSERLVDEVLEMRQQSKDNNYHGPWVMYVSPGWDRFLDDDYKDESDITLRQRLLAIDGIQDIRTLDHLTGYQVLLVQMTTDVVRLVQGMDITTLQWETDGGMNVNFKVMAIWVPQVRSDYDGQTGLVHGVAPS